MAEDTGKKPKAQNSEELLGFISNSFYKDHTVPVKVNGKLKRVAKFDVEALKSGAKKLGLKLEFVKEDK